MSQDVTLRGQNGIAINADSTYNAVQTISKGITTTNFTQADFTLDSFQRLRVSEPRIAFEASFSAQTPASASSIWEATAVASGTVALTGNLFGTTLSTTTSTGSGYWVQSYNHVRYAPGISTLLRFTFCFNSLLSGLTSRLGMFTDQGTFPSTSGDGVFIEASGSVISFVIRSMASGAGSEMRVNQTVWNIDKMDGTGASGVSLDWTKTQHLVMEYQWLGVGTIRFGFETGAGGTIWAHQVNAVNTATTSWSRTGSLPLRAECYTSTAQTVPGTLTLVNCVVMQEGDVNALRGWRYFGNNSGTTVRLGGTAAGLYPVMSLRAASTNDLTKRTRFIPVSITVTLAAVATGATSVQVSLLTFPTPNTGATFAVQPAGSGVTVDIAATATTAVTGTSIWNTVIPNVVGTYTFDLSSMPDNQNVAGYNAAGTVSISGSSVLTLAAGPLTGTASAGASIAAALNWKEIV